MGLFDKILKKDKIMYLDSEVVAAVSGNRFATADINDEVFAQEMMGQTIVIDPNDSKIVAPMNGILEVLYPTGHAFAIRSNDGHGILVHIGINTVNMNGKGFKTKFKQGDKVNAGDIIVEVDFNQVKKAGYDPAVMMITTEGDDIHYDSFTSIKQGMIISK